MGVTIIALTLFMESCLPIVVGRRFVVLSTNGTRWVCVCLRCCLVVSIVRNTSRIVEVYITCQGTKIVHNTVDTEVVTVLIIGIGNCFVVNYNSW